MCSAVSSLFTRGRRRALGAAHANRTRAVAGMGMGSGSGKREAPAHPCGLGARRKPPAPAPAAPAPAPPPRAFGRAGSRCYEARLPPTAYRLPLTAAYAYRLRVAVTGMRVNTTGLHGPAAVRLGGRAARAPRPCAYCRYRGYGHPLSLSLSPDLSAVSVSCQSGKYPRTRTPAPRPCAHHRAAL